MYIIIFPSISITTEQIIVCLLITGYKPSFYLGFWIQISSGFKTLQKTTDFWQWLTEPASPFFHLSSNLLFAQLSVLSV